MPMDETTDRRDPSWWVYHGRSERELADATGLGSEQLQDRPPMVGLPESTGTALRVENAPPWRRFEPEQRDIQLGADYQLAPRYKDLINAALLLRRPLLVTGNPGSGKTALAHSLARELGLGRVLRWSITSRTELKDGLYRYDAIARLQDTQRFQGAVAAGAGPTTAAESPPRWMGRAMARRWRAEQARAAQAGAPSIGKYVKLGPLGTALAQPCWTEDRPYPRVLLIDEIDKCDIDLPNDLLHVFEEGAFGIDELQRDEAREHWVRDHDDRPVRIENGRVRCKAFPIVVMTSNSEREFPGPFRRRCIPLDLPLPTARQLTTIVRQKLRPEQAKAYDRVQGLIEGVVIPAFAQRVRRGEAILAVDQLMQVVHLVMHGVETLAEDLRPAPGDVSEVSGTEADDRPSAEDDVVLAEALWRSLREG